MEEKNYSDEFKEYTEYIVNHSNYSGIPFKRKSDGSIAWVASNVSKMGQRRIEWAKDKAKSLGIDTDSNGWKSKTMYSLHPTKMTVCQVCGRRHSIEYIYLSKNLAKTLNNHFNKHFTIIDDLFHVKKELNNSGYSETEIIEVIWNKLKLDKSPDKLSLVSNEFGVVSKKDITNYDELVKIVESLSRNGFINLTGPGAMSNFPDRLDGYHSYNRCCRTKEDTGRSPENLKTYNKDRRAYENWVDGNIYAANKFMYSKTFNNTSADHIGPISLGFKHDSLLLQKMSRGENSSKRDRISKKDIELLMYLEHKYDISVISWYSKKLWGFIKENYKNIDLELIRVALKKNAHYYLETLHLLKQNGIQDYLYKNLLKPKEKYFNYNYKFNDDGEIIFCENRKESVTYYKEIKRFIDVSFKSLDDYHEKSNRNLKFVIGEEEEAILSSLIRSAKQNDYSTADNYFVNLMEYFQEKIIEDLRSNEK
ncbi:Alw26I/Eco31I/Esp3I family type II restriction endonuclease [Alkalibacillus flavidus]|uniref:Alw26I/Eco31I/Esp3I family type II restriction endonuclease n=1 Tax=Alkalibacillus flavidus TaxID=546021 RepID=A0ABV2KV67_9BACI